MTRKFRAGDRVLVPGVVHTADAGSGLVHVGIKEGRPDGWGTAHVAVSHGILIMQEPAPPQVGDKVIAAGDESMMWTVVAIDGDWAWIKRTHDLMEGGRGRVSMKLDNLAVVKAC